MFLDILGYFKYFPDITIYNLRINKKIKKCFPVIFSFYDLECVTINFFHPTVTGFEQVMPYELGLSINSMQNKRI